MAVNYGPWSDHDQVVYEPGAESLGQVMNVQAINAPGGIKVTWTAVEDATSYNVKMSPLDGVSPESTMNVGNTVEFIWLEDLFPANPLVANESYHFRVQALQLVP